MARHAQYRPDIDGLRAVAIVSVVCYHAFPHAAGGGFAGVDVFFVISGYLISGILFRNAAAGGIKFFEFYRRRINRIFPSLVLVLLFCLGLGWVALFPKEFHQLGADVASGALFSSNFALLGEAGYFDRDAATKPLLHLWSLAIEEQFYIVWPLLIWAIRRWKLPLLPAVCIFAISSFAYNIFASLHDPVADFYSPLSRFWEPAFGALIAAYQFERRADLQERTQDMLSVAGMLAIMFAIFRIATQGYPGVAALVPVGGAGMLIMAGPRAIVNRYILARPLAVWIGAISYPLYLWHWPILAYARILIGQAPPLTVTVCAVTCAFALAVATHYALENPMRFGKYPIRKMTAAVCAMLVAGAIGQYVFLQHGLPNRAVVAANPLLSSAFGGGAGPHITGHCYEQAHRTPRTDGCQIDEREAPVFALIGDSKADALSSGVFRTSRPHGRWLFMGNNSAKGKYMSTTLLAPQDYPAEYTLTRQMLDTIEAHPRIQAVVIANATRNIYGLHDDSSLDGLSSNSSNFEKAFAAFDRVVTELLEHRLRVYLVVDNPTLGHPEDCIGRVTASSAVDSLFGLPAQPAKCTIPYDRYLAQSAPYRNMLRRIVTQHAHRVSLITTADILCDLASNACRMTKDGRLLYGYTDHPSDYAAGLIGARINAAVNTSL